MEVSAALVAIVKIIDYLADIGGKIKTYWTERKQRREYKRAEKAERKKDVEKINDILKS